MAGALKGALAEGISCYNTKRSLIKVIAV